MRRRPKPTCRLVLEAPVHVPDGAGGFAVSWQALGEVWAAIDAGTGREAASAGVPVAMVPWRITLRAAPARSNRRPAAGQRLRGGGRVFSVLAVAEADGAGRYLTCFAREEEVPA